MWGKVVISTISGAIIGYATNYIAIKMLFHPYHRIGPFYGVIPSRLEQFAESLGMLARNYGTSLTANSRDLGRLRDIAYEYTLGRLNWFQKTLYGIAYFFSKGNLENNMPDLTHNLAETLKEITVERIEDMELLELEVNTYRLVGRELFMLEFYGAILGGLLGFATALLYRVI